MRRVTRLLPVPALLALLSSSSVFGNDGLIKTLAGTGQGGSLATNIPATSAQLNSPGGICVDSLDNVFIADSANNRVVRVDANTGILTLVAGNGAASSSGDGGPAVQASLSHPMTVALDSAGNLYVSDLGGQRIRRVDKQTGLISTVAGTGSAGFSGDGGLAQNAKLNSPIGIAFDSAGNLFIADMGNYRIRRIDGQTGIITTVAGNGSNAFTPDGALAAGASLSQPMWVTQDLSGGLLISEVGAMRIRRIDPSSGILTTVAGDGDANFAGDGVPATSTGIGGAIGTFVAPNGNLYLADGTGRIRMVDAATGSIITVAGNGTGAHGVAASSEGGSSQPLCYNTIGDNGPATNATLDGAVIIKLTSTGNLLISDWLDCRVRLVDLPSPYPYTNTALTTSATALQPGQMAMLSASVSPIGTSGTPTGSIQFFDMATGPIGTAALNGGVASLVAGLGNTNARTVMAIYGGDASFNGSGSPQLLLSQSSASKAVATVTLSASQTPSTLGSPTVFTTTVTPPAGAGAPPTGPVLLYDGSALVGTANLVNGVASSSVVFGVSGNHTMKATYLGDNNYAQVTSGSLTQPVGLINSQVLLASSAPNSVYGQPVQFTVSVTPSTATGTVQVMVDQSAISSPSTLVNGTAVVAAPTLNAGSHTVTATYSGDAADSAATSTPLTQTVAQATPSFTVTSSLNPSAPGQSVTLTVTMTPVSTGSALGLQISNPPANLQATWSAGMTSITTSLLSVGTHTVTGTWGGDTNVAAGTSAVLIQTVQANATTTSLTANPNPSAYGATVTLTATVSPASATGSVTFLTNGVPVGSVNLANGQAQLSLATLPVGSNSLTATYGGDTADAASTSAVVTLVVAPAGNPTTLSLVSSANPSIAGRPLWLTATVSPSTATGTIQFLDGATALGTATLANGWATLELSTLSVGAHSITAVYSGDLNDLASTSATLSETISPASPATFVPEIITTLVGSPYGTCPSGVSYCGIVGPAADTAGNIYFEEGYQILEANPGGAVTVIAGTGQAGDTGDGGLALSAALLLARQLAVHNSRVCFSEPTANRVRCVDLGTGLIQGYGTGLANSNGDGGSATNAGFNDPNGVAFDDAGNLYVADFGDSEVRRIDAVTNVVTTIVAANPASGTSIGDGGPAVSASLSGPVSLFYSSGELYVADQGHGVIRRVDLVTGMITSVVSANPNEALNSLAIDQSGNLFFSSAETINVMDPSGNVTPIADSNGYPGYGDDDILATNTVFGGPPSLGWDPVAQRLLIADQTRLRQIFFTPPTTTTLTISANPVSPGSQATLEATVSPATATGSVRFYQNRLLLGSAPLVGGVATFTWAVPLGYSTAGMRAVYGGDANDNLSTSATVTETITTGTTPSTTNLVVTPSPSIAGSPVTLTATVTPATATGSVVFYSNGVSAGTVTLVDGQAQLSLQPASAGSVLIYAQYSGDLTYAGGVSNSVTQTVLAASSVALTSSLNPSATGQPVTFTAAITPATATGTVQFEDGTTPLGTATITGGAATLQTATLSAGTHSISAQYSGDTKTGASTSAPLTQTVNKATSTVTLASSANPSTAGQGITLTATVTPGTAGGSVQFFDGTASLGTATVSGGSAALSLSTLSVGAHSLTAAYSGDASTQPGTSAALVQTVSQATSTVTLASSPNPSSAGQTVTFAATVSPAAATGTVQFLDGGTLLSSATLSGGSATLAISSLAAGAHSITAAYSGDANTTGSTSAVLTQTVNKVTTSVTLASSVNPSTVGQAVTLTAAVSPASATGTVQFLDGANAIATASVANGAASVAIANLAAGAHTITAIYSGDANNLGSTSPALVETVNKVTSTVTLASSLNPSLSGNTVSLTATVTPASATGTVQFLDGGAALGSATLAAGSATLAVSTLAVGTHSLTANYSGDAATAGASSGTLIQTVNLPPPAAPTRLTATAVSSSQINLSWTASPTSGVTYNVYAAASSGFTPSAANRIATGLSGTTYSDTGIPPTTTRYYLVTAKNAGGESAPSNQASATTTAAIGCHIGYSVTGQWPNGFEAAITIKNTGTNPIKGWNLTWTWAAGQKITQAWSATYSQTGANVTLSNESYNATISPGTTLTGIGFNGSYTGTNPAPSAFYVNGTLCK